MDDSDKTQSLLVLRKLTRSIAAAVRGQLNDYLAALTLVLRPEMVFGRFIQGGQRDWVVKSDQALKDLRTLYDKVAPGSPFNLRTELTPPFDLGGLSLEVSPVEYTHVAKVGSSTRKITVRCPLSWTLSYAGFAPPVLKRLLESRTRSPAELQRVVLAYLALHIVTTMQPGVVKVLNGLRFPITTAKDLDFGDLPITRIGMDVATERPPDAVIIESAEVTGMDAFEEVVKLEDIQRLRDPLREQLLAIAREQAPQLVPL